MVPSTPQALPDLTYTQSLDFPLDDLDALLPYQVALIPWHTKATAEHKMWAMHKFYSEREMRKIEMEKNGAALLRIKEEGEDPDDCVIMDFKPARNGEQGGAALDARAGSSGERVGLESLGKVRGEQLGSEEVHGDAKRMSREVGLAAEAENGSQGRSSEERRRDDYRGGQRSSRPPHTSHRTSRRRSREDTTDTRSQRRRSGSPRRESSSRHAHRTSRSSSSHLQDHARNEHSRRSSDRRRRGNSRHESSSPVERYQDRSIPRHASTEQPLSAVQRGKLPEGIHRRRSSAQRSTSPDVSDDRILLGHSSSARDTAVAPLSAPVKRVAPHASPLAPFSLPFFPTNATASAYHTPIRLSPVLPFPFNSPPKASSLPTSNDEPRHLLDTSETNMFVPRRRSPDHRLSERQLGKRPEVHSPSVPSSGSESPDAWNNIASRPHVAEEDSTAMDTSLASLPQANPPPSTFDRRWPDGRPSPFLTPLPKSESPPPVPLITPFRRIRIPFTVAFAGLPGICTLALLSHHLALSPPFLSPPPIALTWANNFSDAPSEHSKIAIAAYTSTAESIKVANHHFGKPLALIQPSRGLVTVSSQSLREFTWDQCCEEVKRTYVHGGGVPNYERERGGPVAVLVRDGLSAEYIKEAESAKRGDTMGKWKAGRGLESKDVQGKRTEERRVEEFVSILEILDEYADEEEPKEGEEGEVENARMEEVPGAEAMEE